MTRRRARSRNPRTRSRLTVWALVVGGVGFGFLGGEYSTVDWWKLEREVAAERDVISRIEAEVDSLEPEAEALENDPSKQEWVARQKFGMVRPGEVMYQVDIAR